MTPFRRRKSESFRARRRRHSAPGHIALRPPETLESRTMMAAQPFGAMSSDTAEYMLGDVYVNVVLMESNTQTSAKNDNSETWTAAAISSVKQKITEGLQWWEKTLAAKTRKHELNFELDFTHADTPVLTSYEPITRPSTDFQFWIYDFLNLVGYNTGGNFHDDIKAFNHDQLVAHDADWSFTIFVVNDEKDSDHQFAPGGFSKAFAFAGGELLVSPASRPASTYSHEAGHQFWALDEYRPDGNYDRSRGYYDTQNLNSWDNPSAGFSQKPSIMSNGQSLETAYANHTSPPSTLEMLGWKDSDGDGIFDVLDVPLTLDGSGYYDLGAGEYRFSGTSAVQTLPNQNRSGLQNDISINLVSRAEYRIDGGAWQTAATYDSPQADLDLRIAVPSSSSSIDIRTIDAITGVTSPTFTGFLDRPAGVLKPGINGVVWKDEDHDGTLDVNERGLSGVTLYLVDENSQLVSLRKSVEPDAYASTARLNNVSPDVTLRAFGSSVVSDSVFAYAATGASTGTNLFASSNSQCGDYCTDWTPETRQLRIDFTNPTSTVSLDAIGSSVAGFARLEIYGSDNQLLARYTTGKLSTGQSETMTLSRPTDEIKYAIAKGHANSVVRFDNLQFGPHESATTDQYGAFSFSYLPAGTYHVKTIPTPRQTTTSPQSGTQTVDLGEGESHDNVDFGIVIQVSPWQNPDNRFDVNNDGKLAPLDALAVINDLNRGGSRALSSNDPAPPYIDVNGDFRLAPLDALHVINELNQSNFRRSGSNSLMASHASSNRNSAAEGETPVAEDQQVDYLGVLARPSTSSESDSAPTQSSNARTNQSINVEADAVRASRVLMFASVATLPEARKSDEPAQGFDEVESLECLLDDLAEDIAQAS